ncbi:MAG: hypothetical protein PUB18_03960 [bacterium]|nr:hypothetical protein [bacterium]
MKKVEAQALAPEKSKLVIEYICQILSDPEKVNAQMNFTSYKREKMCTLDIYIPSRNVQKRLDLGISKEHSLVLYEQLLNDLLDTFAEHETIGVTKYYSLKSMEENFSGINAVNSAGSKIKINLNSSGKDFMELISHYTQRYDEFMEMANHRKSQNTKLR